MFALAITTHLLLLGKHPFQQSGRLESDKLKVADWTSLILNQSLSEESKDFILKIGSWSRIHRLSSVQALHHPFISREVFNKSQKEKYNEDTESYLRMPCVKKGLKMLL